MTWWTFHQTVLRTWVGMCTHVNVFSAVSLLFTLEGQRLGEHNFTQSHSVLIRSQWLGMSSVPTCPYRCDIIWIKPNQPELTGEFDGLFYHFLTSLTKRSLIFLFQSLLSAGQRSSASSFLFLASIYSTVAIDTSTVAKFVSNLLSPIAFYSFFSFTYFFFRTSFHQNDLLCSFIFWLPCLFSKSISQNHTSC